MEERAARSAEFGANGARARASYGAMVFVEMMAAAAGPEGPGRRPGALTAAWGYNTPWVWDGGRRRWGWAAMPSHYLRLSYAVPLAAPTAAESGRVEAAMRAAMDDVPGLLRVQPVAGPELGYADEGRLVFAIAHGAEADPTDAVAGMLLFCEEGRQIGESWEACRLSLPDWAGPGADARPAMERSGDRCGYPGWHQGRWTAA